MTTTNHQARFLPLHRPTNQLRESAQGNKQNAPPAPSPLLPYLTYHRSVVLHNMSMSSHKSTFPCDIGVKISGVDSSPAAQRGAFVHMDAAKLLSFGPRVGEAVLELSVRLALQN